jgi:hypothetical protein
MISSATAGRSGPPLTRAKPELEQMRSPQLVPRTRSCSPWHSLRRPDQAPRAQTHFQHPRRGHAPFTDLYDC